MTWQAGKIKIKVHREMTCINKIIMIAKYLNNTTSVHSQRVNSTLLCHTLSYLCSWQQQLLNFYKYSTTHTMNYHPFRLFASHDNDHMIYIFIWDLKRGTWLDLWNIKLIWYGLITGELGTALNCGFAYHQPHVHTLFNYSWT